MDIKTMIDRVAAAVQAVREANPLVGSVTNGVTMEFVANAQLAAGGSAAMVYLPDEAEYLVEASGAFYVNMGTLMPVYEETIPRPGGHRHRVAARAAARRYGGVPAVDHPRECVRDTGASGSLGPL